MMALSPVLTPIVKTRYDTVSLFEMFMTLGASVPAPPHTAAKGSSVSVQWQGTGEEVCPAEGHSIASGHSCPTSNPGAWHRGHGLRSIILVPTGVLLSSLARDIRCWGTQAVPRLCLRHCFQTAVSTHYSSHRVSYESKATVQRIFFASAQLQPPPEFLHKLLLQTETEEFTSHGTYLPHELLHVGRVTEQNAKEMRVLGASEQLFTWAKWRGRERLRIHCKEIK